MLVKGSNGKVAVIKKIDNELYVTNGKDNIDSEELDKALFDEYIKIFRPEPSTQVKQTKKYNVPAIYFMYAFYTSFFLLSLAFLLILIKGGIIK